MVSWCSSANIETAQELALEQHAMHRRSPRFWRVSEIISAPFCTAEFDFSCPRRWYDALWWWTEFHRQFSRKPCHKRSLGACEFEPIRMATAKRTKATGQQLMYYVATNPPVSFTAPVQAEANSVQRDTWLMSSALFSNLDSIVTAGSSRD